MARWRTDIANDTSILQAMSPTCSTPMTAMSVKWDLQDFVMTLILVPSHEGAERTLAYANKRLTRRLEDRFPAQCNHTMWPQNVLFSSFLYISFDFKILLCRHVLMRFVDFSLEIYVYCYSADMSYLLFLSFLRICIFGVGEIRSDTFEELS